MYQGHCLVPLFLQGQEQDVFPSGNAAGFCLFWNTQRCRVLQELGACLSAVLAGALQHEWKAL